MRPRRESEGDFVADDAALDADVGGADVVDLDLVRGVGGLGDEGDRIAVQVEALDRGVLVVDEDDGDLQDMEAGYHSIRNEENRR